MLVVKVEIPEGINFEKVAAHLSEIIDQMSHIEEYKDVSVAGMAWVQG